MGARTHRELRAWQLADKLRRQILALTSTDPACRDRKFCDSIRETISSVCRNLSEGFGRYTHRDFANFVRIALGSLTEVQDHLDEALERQYVDPPTYEESWDTSEHAKASTLALLKYLRTTRDETARKLRPPRRT